LIMSIPQEIKNLGTVLFIAEGQGIKKIYPLTEAYKKAGNRVMCIIGASTKNKLILADQMGQFCDELFIATEDGSSGQKGKVLDVLKELFGIIEKSTHTKYPELIFASGSPALLGSVSEIAGSCGVSVITKEENA